MSEIHDTTRPGERGSLDVDILDDFMIQRFTVPVQLELDEFDSVDDCDVAVRDAVAKTIVGHVDSLTEDNVEYVASRVDFDYAGLENALADDNVHYVHLDTETQLGIIDEATR